MDKLVTLLTELFKNPWLALTGFGLVPFVLGALGNWPGSQGPKMEAGWRIVLASAGGIFAVIGVSQLWGHSQGKAPHNIEGKYHIKGTNYEVTFRHIAKNLYRANHLSWEGVGLYDGKFYHGIYKYKAGSDLPDHWGVHKARLRLVDGRLSFSW